MRDVWGISISQAFLFLCFLTAGVTSSVDDGDKKCSHQSTSCEASIVSSPPPERCVIMVKPDGVQRGLVGEIVRRFERKGFQMIGMKMMRAERETLESHYAEHAGKSFFPGLIDYMLKGPVVPMVWQGKNIVPISRSMLGATDPVNSLPGTIRGDFGLSKQMNLCHVSDSQEAAEREIALWFQDGDIQNWTDEGRVWKW